MSLNVTGNTTPVPDRNTYSTLFNVSTIWKHTVLPCFDSAPDRGDTIRPPNGPSPNEKNTIFFYQSFKDYSEEPFSLIKRNF